jgi:hypothetical protein
MSPTVSLSGEWANAPPKHVLLLSHRLGSDARPLYYSWLCFSFPWSAASSLRPLCVAWDLGGGRLVETASSSAAGASSWPPRARVVSESTTPLLRGASILKAFDSLRPSFLLDGCLTESHGALSCLCAYTSPSSKPALQPAPGRRAPTPSSARRICARSPCSACAGS